MAEQPRRKLGELLVERGFISEEQLREALRPELQAGKRLGEILLDRGVLSSDELNWALSELLGIPYVELSSEMVDPDLARSIPEEVLRRHQVFPVVRADDVLTVVMADPTNRQAVTEIEALTGARVSVAIASRGTVTQLLDRAFPAGAGAPGEVRYAEVESSQGDRGDPAGGMQSYQPLITALREGATEVHLEPGPEEVRVRNRIDGHLVDRDPLPRRALAQVLSRLRLVEALRGENAPRQAHVRTRLGGQDLDLDILVFPSLHGEAVTMRIWRRGMETPTIEGLGCPVATREALGRLVSGTGLVLVTGPDARVRSAVLYALAGAAAAPSKKMVTIERAVSYVVPGFVQTGLARDFEEGATTILAHPLDVALVEDVGSALVCRAALASAERGALVLGGLHSATTTMGLAHLMTLDVPRVPLLGAIQGLAGARRHAEGLQVDVFPMTEETRQDLMSRQGPSWTSRTS